MHRAVRISLYAVGVLVALVVGLFVGGELYYGRKVYRALPGPKLPRLSPIASLGSPSAAGCAACHAEIAAEWRGSAHGQAMQRPMVLAERELEGRPYFCVYCHAPLIEQQPKIVDGLYAIWPRQLPRQRPNPHFQAGLTDEGVTCVACHQRGAELVGPHAVSNAPHPTRADASFGNAQLCASCHSLDIPLGDALPRPVQDTLGEWQEYRAAGGDKQCIDCHMPDVGLRPLAPGYPARRSRSHALRGPADVDFLRTGIVVQALEAGSTTDGAWARVRLYNGSGHRIPTAEPRRRVQVELEALGDGDVVLARATQRIERRLDVVHLIEKPGTDSTLRPRETRDLELRLSAVPAALHLRVTVVYYLWDPTDAVARRAGRDENSLRRVLHQRSFPLPKAP